MTNENETKEEEYVEVPVEEEPKREKEHNPFEPTQGMWPHLGI